jgi:hypothetical protein
MLPTTHTKIAAKAPPKYLNMGMCDLFIASHDRMRAVAMGGHIKLHPITNTTIALYRSTIKRGRRTEAEVAVMRTKSSHVAYRECVRFLRHHATKGGPPSEEHEKGPKSSRIICRMYDAIQTSNNTSTLSARRGDAELTIIGGFTPPIIPSCAVAIEMPTQCTIPTVERLRLACSVRTRYHSENRTDPEQSAKVIPSTANRALSSCTHTKVMTFSARPFHPGPTATVATITANVMTL